MSSWKRKIVLLAGGVTLPDGESIDYPAGYDFRLTSLGGIISRLNTFVFPLAGMLLLVFLVVSGFQYMTSQGDPKALSAAKGRLTSAVIGFVIIFIAFWVVQFIAMMLGLPTILTVFNSTGPRPPGGTDPF